ncbi:PREDICTED: uncharacterized protein LOC109359739 [Lupinus angustifolius]|uniref:uncharacterized protein LOC109359739 n=1 Tax=Lupinus angustifolius TaxID=3871 RepID=UPI00092FC531|nr:PREDICTED: uncharacterized protein LOC109359739 [Lupinus angustifolius]
MHQEPEPVEHHMQVELRRSRRGRILSSKYPEEDYIILTNNSEPQNFLEAVEATKKKEWIKVIEDEMNSLYENHTYDLVEFPKEREALKNKWVYRLKVEGGGSRPQYKAEIVVTGFNQKKGVDFHEIFSPVVNAIIPTNIPHKLKDPRSVTILVIVGAVSIGKALVDLRASGNARTPFRGRRKRKLIRNFSDDQISPLTKPEKDQGEDDRKEQELKLKELPLHLKYAFLEGNTNKQVIISNSLSTLEEQKLIQVLEKHQQTIGWTLQDLKRISPSFCMQKIMMEDDKKVVAQPQIRVNLKMKEVVRKEEVKMLEARMIYPISDRKWVSLVQVVPKKGGMIVIRNDNNELIPTRVVIGWRVCIDYRKVNEAAIKCHFPLPFMDQMLERLLGRAFYFFLDGYSGYNQIVVDP